MTYGVKKMKKPLLFARQLISEVVLPGDTAVDATCGNGHDTVFLAGLTGKDGRVLALDIQAEAIEKTRQRLAAAGFGENTELILDGHENLARYLPGEVKAVMFNLGYLPGGDHGLVTKPDTTVAAIAAAAEKLARGGIITLVVYTGHPGGAEEYLAVRSYLEKLPQDLYTVLEYRFINQANNPPLLLAVARN